MAKNPFDIFAISEKKAKIKALNGAEITYRELTMAESDGFTKRLLKDFKGKGEPTVDIGEATQMNYEKIALAVSNPTLSVEYLQSLGSSASKATAEILALIEGNKDEVDTEGNSKS